MTSRITESMWDTPHTHQPYFQSFGSETNEAKETLLDGPAALRELVIQFCRHVDAQPVDALTHSSSGHPISVYLPENYEPGYAYPLVIWLHGDGGSEEDIQLLMPLISDRNYIGLAIRAPQGNWQQAAGTDTVDFEMDLHATVGRIRKQFNVHSERIYLSGFGNGATLAARLLLSQPEWFAGAAMLGGQLPNTERPLANLDALRNKRVLWMAGETDRSFDPDAAGNALRLLHIAGVQTSIRTFETGHQIVEGMLTELNNWIMRGINTATFV